MNSMPQLVLPDIPSRVYAKGPKATLSVRFGVGGEAREKLFRLKRGFNVLVFSERDSAGRRSPLEIRRVEVEDYEASGPITTPSRLVTFSAGRPNFIFRFPRRLEWDLPAILMISEFLFGDWDPAAPAGRPVPFYRRWAVRRCLMRDSA